MTLFRILWVIEKLFFWPARICMTPAIFAKELRWGLYYDYPICCVLQFTASRAFGFNPKQGLRRGGVRLSHTKVYVPCSYHKCRHPAWRSHAQWYAETRSGERYS